MAGWTETGRLIDWTENIRLPGCPFHVAVIALRPGPDGRRRLASGRGLSHEEAHERALMEAAERASAVFRGDEKLTSTSWSRSPTACVAPHSLTLISDRQYRGASAWNGAVDAEHRLPARHDPERETGWLAGESLGSEGRLIPAAHCLLGYPSLDEGFPVPDSSGLAAGPSREAAMVLGFLELVERDAIAIWWYGRVRRPAIEAPAKSARLVQAHKSWLEGQGRQLQLLDLTHDFGLPVVAAIAQDRDGGNLSFGFSCATDRANAIEGALGECVQFDVSRLLRRRLGPGRASRPPDWLNWCDTADPRRHPHLVPSEARDRPAPAEEQGEALDVVRCAALCARHGLELIFVDLTRAYLGVPVTKAVVPNLRPIWPRFAPGRLYDVPVALGWRARRLPEKGLNPVPILY